MDDPAPPHIPLPTGAPLDDAPERTYAWDVATPGVLAFRLEQVRLRYADLLADLRVANTRAALLLAGALVASPLAFALALAPLPAWLGSSDILLIGVVAAYVLSIAFLLGALLDLLRALSPGLPTSPYRMDELGHPERYVTVGDRNDFPSSLGVMQYRQIQRLRPAVRWLETELAARNVRLQRGVAQLITGLLLLFVPSLVLVVGALVWPG